MTWSVSWFLHHLLSKDIESSHDQLAKECQSELCTARLRSQYQPECIPVAET